MFYLFFAAHLVADFIFQPYWLVLRKRRWSGLAIHGAIVLAVMALLPLFDRAALRLWPAMLLITAVHVAADWWKVNRADRLFKHAISGFMLDQAIHFGTLALALSLMLPQAQIWRLDASAAAHGALYLAAYVIAAFATPIGVMIWLDPGFRHGPVALRARFRSLLAGSIVLGLTLIGGVIALPATLLGYAALNGRPASQHPLDTGTGLLTTLAVAGTLAAALVVVG